MKQERLQQLLEAYILDTITGEGREELATLLETPEARSLFATMLQAQLVQHTYDTADELPAVYARIQAGLEAHIREERKAPVLQPRRFTTGWKVAAAILGIVMATGIYFLLSRQPAAVAPISQLQHDLPPGGNKAVLTLANGTKITLDSADNGALAQQGNTRIIKLDSGQLAYNVQGQTAAVTYNTLATPRGGQYQVTLPDGTHVWLNAESSLYFPTAFTGEERKVALTGEAYFEVAPKADQPFRVTVALPAPDRQGMMVEVLGTHFNFNAYTEEKTIHTTLMEGSVKAITGNTKVAMQPGEQASLPVNGNSAFVVSRPNLMQVMAWKNGYFRFKGDNIRTIMQQLARWYDITPVYEGNMELKNFSGTISRNENISGVLKMLEATDDITFKVEGKKVIVYAR